MVLVSGLCIPRCRPDYILLGVKGLGQRLPTSALATGKRKRPCGSLCRGLTVHPRTVPETSSLQLQNNVKVHSCFCAAWNYQCLSALGSLLPQVFQVKGEKVFHEGSPMKVLSSFHPMRRPKCKTDVLYLIKDAMTHVEEGCSMARGRL
eukprot:6296171-Amphidinium_carterae.1